MTMYFSICASIEACCSAILILLDFEPIRVKGNIVKGLHCTFSKMNNLMGFDLMGHTMKPVYLFILFCCCILRNSDLMFRRTATHYTDLVAFLIFDFLGLVSFARFIHDRRLHVVLDTYFGRLYSK